MDSETSPKENQPRRIKGSIQNLIQKLSEKQVGQKSPKIEPAPIIYFTHSQALNYLNQITLGSIYLGPWSEDRFPIKSEMDQIIQNFKSNQGQGAIISGTLGSGKTTCLHYLAYRLLTELPASLTGHNSLLDGQYRIESINSPKQIQMCRTSKLISYLMERQAEKVEELEKSEILMLDDFARHYSADYPLSKLEDFIEYRYAFQKPTFITLDVPLSVMAEKKEWSAMVDRFKDSKWMTGALVIAGESQRK